MRRVVGRLAAVGLFLALSAVAAFLIKIDGPWAGPVLLALTPTHGIHEGDLPVIGAWVGGLVAFLAVWWALREPGSSAEPPTDSATEQRRQP